MLLNGATYYADSFISGGGVARNLAEGIYKLYGDVHFISAVGNDEIGTKLKTILPNSCTNIIEMKNLPTSICLVVINKGDCKILIGDMEIHKSITPELVYRNEDRILESPLVIMDANIPIETMSVICKICSQHNKPVLFQPTDMRFAHKPFMHLPRNEINSIKIISPNLSELYEICTALKLQIDNIPKPENLIKKKDTILILAAKLLQLASEYFDCIILTLGEYGIAISRRTNSDGLFFNDNYEYINYNGSIQIRYYDVLKIDNIVNVSGAGDSFTSGFISAILQRKSEVHAISLGRYAAKKALQSQSAVPEKYFDENYENEIEICKPNDLLEMIHELKESRKYF